MSPEPWYGLGRTQAARGDGAAAAISFRQAIALYPRYGVAHYALAQALNKQGAAGEARRHLAQYERFRFLGPNAGDPELDRVSRLNLSAPNLIRQGADAEAAGRLDESIRLHERALAADPAFAQAHANLIQLHARTGNPAKAEEAYRKAMAINPAFADAHYNFGVLAFGQHRTAEARAAFEETLRVNPYHAEAHASLGYLLESQGREAQARRHYQEAIANDPQYRIAHFHLGRLLTRQGDYRRAAAHLEKTLLPEDDYSPGCHYALGIAYGRAGDRAKAVETDITGQSHETKSQSENRQ